MIGRITGALLETIPPTLCIDVGGVGYEIDVPMSTLYQLPELGKSVTLFTHLIVREDAQLLYGFATASERTAFRALIRVSGVGARMALAVLSGMSVQALNDAITRQDTGLLTRVPGIGKKTAERLLLELRGKLGADLGADLGDAAGTVGAGGRADVTHALLSLGYSHAEIQTALKTLPDTVDVTEAIRLALKALSRHQG